MLSASQATSFPAAAPGTPNPQKRGRGAIIKRHTKTRGNTRTRGTNFPPRKKQRVQTALLELLCTKLREGHAFRDLTSKVLAWELADVARTLVGDDVKEINLIASKHPHAFPNMVTVLFQNEFRKGAAKERPGARTKGSSAASSRGFARVLSKFARSDDLAADMAQLWHSCVDEDLGKDKLEAVCLMRHFQARPTSKRARRPSAPEEAASGASCKTSAIQDADEVADECLADPFFAWPSDMDQQCLTDSFLAWPSDMDQDQDWLHGLK
jgi:hypothetical protein